MMLPASCLAMGATKAAFYLFHDERERAPARINRLLLLLLLLFDSQQMDLILTWIARPESR
jgi:hypothetical protein